MKKISKEKRNDILLVLLILCAIAPFYLTLGCPIRYFTGISCLGCGMSRALEALLHLDFAGAFHYHPLIFIMPIVVLVLIFKKKLPPTLVKVLYVLCVILFIATYFIRLFSGSEVVYFRPETGALYKYRQAFKEIVRTLIEKIYYMFN